MPKTHNIHLTFVKVGLAGMDYGRFTWLYQVEPKLKLNDFQPGDKINLYWNDSVKYVSTSFLMGFFEKLKNQIGIIAIESDVNHISINKIPSLESKNLI